MKVLVKFPSRERPDKFIRILDSLISKTEDKVNTKIVVTADEDDLTMNNNQTLFMINLYSPLIEVIVDFGKSNNKIHAINRDVEKYTDWDILVLTSDDMTPVEKGWDNIIRNDMKRYFPDTDGVLYYNDGYTPLNTLPIIGKKYYERFNYIYNPEYRSFFCDNEFHDVALLNNKMFMSKAVLFRHDHPANIGNGWDSLYEKNQADWNHDQKLWEERKSRGYDLCIDLASLLRQ